MLLSLACAHRTAASGLVVHQARLAARDAKKFYDWALTAGAQEVGAAAKQFQLPSNKSAKVDPQVRDFKKIKFINYDYAKYGASAERRRLIGKWEKEVNALPG